MLFLFFGISFTFGLNNSHSNEGAGNIFFCAKVFFTICEYDGGNP